MASYDPTTAEVLVFTFKEGVLSAVAHDLKLRVSRFSITVEGDAVKAELAAGSLRVVNAMKDGQDNPSGLNPAKDHEKIEENIVSEVLHPGRHPAITFTGRVAGGEVSGTLSLHGVSRPVRAPTREVGDRVVAEFRLHQPDFGIKPFSAMLGTLKVKPDVTVRVSLPK